MKKNLFIALIILLASCSQENHHKTLSTTGVIPTNKFIEYYNATYEALDSSNYAEYAANAEILNEYAPYDFSLKILYADALVSINKTDEAKRILNSMLKLNSHLAYERLQQAQYTFIKNLDNFDYYLSKTKEDANIINNSDVAYTIIEKDLIPEGIAYDEKTQTTYLSSVAKRKVISISKDGTVKDFIKTGQDNILATLGMEIDPVRRHLWICSEWEKPQKILPDSLLYTAMYKYDVETGDLIKKYTLKDTVPRLLNDVAIASDGTVYITESNQAKVYVIRPDKDSLELYINSDYDYYANGITISDDDKHLYFTHFFGGTLLVDLRTNEIKRIKHSNNISIGRVDGLAYYKNSLIMHQDEICRYYLNEAGDSIIRKEVIERNNPLFDGPTTGEVAGDDYIYIANSQLSKFDNEGNLFPPEQLDSVYLLKTNLLAQ